MNSIAHRTDSASSVPALDLTPTGHALPFLADDQARERTEPLLTSAQSTLVVDDSLGARMTAPVETALRNVDSDPDPDLARAPFLGAQVVVSEYRPQAYGRHTRIWLHNGTVTGELTPAQAREALEAMREFIPRLEAVIAVAEQEAAGDFEGDPEIARLDREAEGRA